jgi:hypothetical protein
MERNTVEAAYTALVPFLRERLRAIPLQKLKLLTRWAQVCAFFAIYKQLCRLVELEVCFACILVPIVFSLDTMLLS